MEIYRDTDPELADCEPTIKLIRRVNALIVAMTSRSCSNSLTIKEESKHMKVIQICIIPTKEIYYKHKIRVCTDNT